MDRPASEEEEGTDYTALMIQSFGRANAEGRARLDERKRAERRAGRTEKERARARKRSVRSKQFNFRTTKEVHAIIKSLAASQNTSQAHIIEQAVLAMASGKDPQGELDA